VKKEYPDFIFIAEAYNGIEGYLQELGFDYTYNKYLSDKLMEGNIPEVKDFLTRVGIDFLLKSTHFAENHDEAERYRIANVLRDIKSYKAFITILSTIPGLPFFYLGQLDGEKARRDIKISVLLITGGDEQGITFAKKIARIGKGRFYKDSV